jgi:hypothetical protein
VTVVDLPPCLPLQPHNFLWGDLDGSTFISQVDYCYSEEVHWSHLENLERPLLLK